MTELEKKVIRCYKDKGMSLSMLSNFGICGFDKATAILHKYNVMRSRTEFVPRGGKPKRAGKVDPFGDEAAMPPRPQTDLF
jgi:hypothetical protein